MDLTSLAALVTVAWILMRTVEAAVKPAWAKLKLDPFWLLYVSIALGIPLGLATGINAFPVFSQWPLVGRILSALIVGLGPSFIYDLTDKKS